MRSFHTDLSDIYQGVKFEVAGEDGNKTKGSSFAELATPRQKVTFLTRQDPWDSMHARSAESAVSGRRELKIAMRPFSDNSLRTDDEIRVHARMAEAYQTVIYGIKGFSALRLYSSDNITSTSVDIMHCVYQEVTKTLCKFSFDDEFVGLPFSLHAVAGGISQSFVSLTPPSYFKRMLRSIMATLKLWKA